MARYVARRAAQGLFVLWAAFTIAFFVLYLLPSDPAALAAGSGGEVASVDPALLDDLRARYGLDRPVLVQYADALWGPSGSTSGRRTSRGRRPARWWRRRCRRRCCSRASP